MVKSEAYSAWGTGERRISDREKRSSKDPLINDSGKKKSRASIKDEAELGELRALDDEGKVGDAGSGDNMRGRGSAFVATWAGDKVRACGSGDNTC